MKRWNGWGDSSIHYPLPETSVPFLENKLGTLTPSPDTAWETALRGVPDPAHLTHPLFQTDPETRLLHARGQSLPDWIALRSGRISAYPDAVAYPTTPEDIRTLLAYATRAGIPLIPYGGGTSVVGHINPRGDAPVLTVDLSRLNQLLHLDETSHLATFGAGITGPDLEAALHPRGYTLGHFPQSFEYSTLGGWIAARSSGQQSYHYGRIEDLFAGGHVETPLGPLTLPPFPASAAGPDLRQIILGSEGRMGIIAHATVRVRPLPETEDFYGVFFKDWESGVRAVRAAAQAGLPLSMMRFSDADETEANLALAGTSRTLELAGRGLTWLGYGPARGLLIFGVTGSHREVSQTRREAYALFRSFGGLPTGTLAGHTWRKNRFLTPYLRNTLWERGVAVDTLETAVPWANVLSAAHALKGAVHTALAPTGERALVIAHLSHVYRDGASIYVTYLFRRTPDPDELLERWQKMKSAASQAIAAHGGTISHQHGVGVDHAPYLEAEKGALGMEMLRTMSRTFDPQGIMNPGKLFSG